MGTVVLRKAGSALQIWPESPGPGDTLHLAFLARAALGEGRNTYEITLLDGVRRRVATIARGEMRPVSGVIFASWNGRVDGGEPVPAGRYILRVVRPSSDFVLERTIFIGP